MTSQNKKEFELPVSDEISVAPIFETEKKHSALEFVIVLAKHKTFILCFVTGAFVLSIVGSLLLPTYYTSEAKLLPPQQGSSMASAMMGELGQLGSILSAVGGKDLLKNPSDLYAAMLRSRTVADHLIDRFSLMSIYKAKKRVDAEKKLDSLTEITVNKEGTISIAVQDRDPRRAAEIGNAYIDELDKLTKTLAVTDAGKRRIFFEREARVAQDQLEAAERELKATQESTGIIQIDSQSRFMLQAYEDLRAQLTEKEIEIESMRAFATAQNPDLIRLEHQRDALRAQVSGMEKGQGGSPVGDIALEKVPEKSLKYLDKFREVTYRSSLLQLMLKQYQVARIDEARDAAIIQVLDLALPPEKKSSPKRAIIVLTVTFFAFLMAVLWAYSKEMLERAREDPQYVARLQLLKFYLFRMHKSPDLQP